MADVSFDDVLKLAEQLTENEQNKLIYTLRLKQEAHKPQSAATPEEAELLRDTWFLKRGSEYVDYYRSPTREELLRDAEDLRQTSPRPEDRLLGKYASPDIPEMSEEEFHAQMHAIATGWEQELDEFHDDKS